MPGSRIAVVVKGEGLPYSGVHYSAYKTACRELSLKRSKAERHADRAELKESGVVYVGGYEFHKAY